MLDHCYNPLQPQVLQLYQYSPLIEPDIHSCIALCDYSQKKISIILLTLTTDHRLFSFFMFLHCYFPGASVQATVISFIYSFNFSPLLIEGQNGCFHCYIRGTGMLQHSHVLTGNTMAVFCPFYSLYTFNIYPSRFLFPHFSWTVDTFQN